MKTITNTIPQEFTTNTQEAASSTSHRIWLRRTKTMLDLFSGISFLLGVLAIHWPDGDSPALMLLTGIGTIVCMTISILCDFFAAKLDCSYGAHRCRHCGHVHQNTDSRFSQYTGFGSRRYLQCPACSRKSWHEKVLEDL